MRASERTKERMLGEKRCGTRGRTAPHYEYKTESIVNNAYEQSRTKRKRCHTYQCKENSPRGEDERGEECRDGAKGQSRLRVEGMG
jgi:hypothetical protein